MGELEAASDLITGGLIAGAVERASASGVHGEAHDGVCLNCGTGLIGAYCHRCGQPEHIHRSLVALWHDLAHGVLHFEGKIWNTLPLLAWRPGELTRRYVHGERARFVSPMALFLFSVFLMFALFSLIGAHLERPEPQVLTPAQVAKARVDLPKAEARLAAAKEERTRIRAAHGDTEAIDDKIDTIDDEVGMLRGMAKGEAPNVTNMNVHSGWAALDRGLVKAKTNPNLVLYKIQSSAYKLSWVLIPLSTPFLWLMFAWRPQFKLYDHAVFVTYSLSFMSLLIIVLTLLSKAGLGAGAITAAVFVIPPVHIYRQLRGAYGIGRWSALARTAALLVFAGFCLSIFLLLLIAMGVLG